MRSGGWNRDGRTDAGFTIIELMVVVVVLGVLVGLVLLAVGGFQQQTTVAACQVEVDSLRTANVVYRQSLGTDAADEAALMDAGFLDRPPRHVTITNGITDPSTADGCG